MSGTGKVKIDGGSFDAAASFGQDVAFTGTTGELILAQSQGYSGAITGLSTSGGTSLDLQDIGFVSAGEATFVGTASGGTLTVTDGTHTAQITLAGDYIGSTFTASDDGHGGTMVVDPKAAAFAGAMAGLAGPGEGAPFHARALEHAGAAALARPA